MARSRGFGTKSDSRCRNPRVSVGELAASPSPPTGDRLTELAISRRASIFAGVDQPVNLGETTRAVGAQLTGSAVHDNLTWPLPALGVAGLGNVTLPASTTAGFATLAPPPPLPLPTTLPGPLPPPPPPAPSAPPLVPPVPNDVFENLAGCHMRNADRIHPEWQQREIGDTVLMHPLAGIKLSRFEPNRSYALQGWYFALEPLRDGRTRLFARSRIPRGVASLGYALFIELPHFVMERKMMLTIKQRAEEAHAAAAGSGPTR
jgi:hypothetical protein